MLRRAALLAACLWAWAAGGVGAQAYRAPRTPDGQPNLQGGWTNVTLTPLQRGKDFTGLTATPAEAAAWLAKVEGAENNKPPPPKPGDPPPKPDVGESEWYQKGRGLIRMDGGLRSSIITSPINGRLPYNVLGKHAVADAERRDEEVFDGPEDRIGDERCLMAIGSSAPPPMLPPPYNAAYRIVQTPGLVTIAVEMIHDVRVIRLAGAHDPGPPKWLGDSVGRWEGETLVVETVNQHPLTAERFTGGGILFITPGAKVVERFTRTSPTEIRYAFTVEDASVFTQPWSGELVFVAEAQPTYEYACHEGNYALANILRGAREKERLAAEKGKAAKPAAPPVATSATPAAAKPQAAGGL